MIVFVDNDDRDDVGLDEGIEVQKLMNQMQKRDRKAFFCGIWQIFVKLRSAPVVIGGKCSCTQVTDRVRRASRFLRIK